MKNGGVGFGGRVDVCMCECGHIHEHAGGRREAQCYGKFFFWVSIPPLII